MPGTASPASPASPAFRRRRPAAVTAAVLCCVLAGGAGAWALFGPEGGDGGCAGLLRNERVRAALGEAHDSGLGCARLGAEIKKATTGPEQGRHSLRQAQAMKDVLVAVDEELQRPGGRVSRRLFTPLAEALADYPADTEAILGVRSTEYAFKGPPAEPAWRDDEGVHMSVPRTALLRVVRVLSEEPAAYVALRQAATRRAAEGLVAAGPGPGDAGLDAAAGRNARTLGVWDAVAADVRHDGVEEDTARWDHDVIKGLTGNAGERSARAARAKDPVNRLVGTWRRMLLGQHASLEEQSAVMADLRGKAVGLGPAVRGSLRKACLDTASGARERTLRELG